MDITKNRKPNRTLFNRWVVAGALLIALVLLIFFFTILWIIRPGSPVVEQSTAIINVITAPTATQLWSTSTHIISSTELPLNESPPPGVVVQGAYVQVISTGGDGLRLRSTPGLNNQVLMLGSEAEVFFVQDGPEEVDGYTWWFLVGPYDDTRQGWAVSNYLTPIQIP